MFHPTRRPLALIVCMAVAFAGVLMWAMRIGKPVAAQYRTAIVTRASLESIIRATGTLEPEELVDVGAQVVGMIAEFGRDPCDPQKPVDYLSEVEEGTVLARIEDAVYKARFDKAEAVVAQRKVEIEQAEANLHREEANQEQSRAKRREFERDWIRAQKLKTENAVTDATMVLAQGLYEIADADTKVAAAAILQAQSGLRLAQEKLPEAIADRSEAETNLKYTVIRSPVKGTIVDRRVNIGQTVVSTLSAPSLFVIAKDLKRLQVWASVNEADVARIRPGQPVRFAVDALPRDVFHGKVGQVRLNATMTQNVVTYTVVVDVDNSDGRLLPYLTANVQFEVASRPNVLTVPNAALRWSPQAPPAVAAVAAQSGSPQPSTKTPTESFTEETGTVWVEHAGRIAPVLVWIGLSDGVRTEILDGLTENQRVVVGDVQPGEATQTASPFAPRMQGARRP